MEKPDSPNDESDAKPDGNAEPNAPTPQVTEAERAGGKKAASRRAEEEFNDTAKQDGE